MHGLTASGDGGREGAAMSLTIGTWNLENLFRPSETGFGPRDPESYTTKLTTLASLLEEVAPDVVAVQEVGDPDALSDLAQVLDGRWHTATSKHFSSRHPIRVGFLSRHPLRVVADVRAFPHALAPIAIGDDPADTTIQMGRGALAVEVAPPSVSPVTLVSCHLKSKLLSFPAGPGGSRRFQPKDEAERARFAAYALYRRTAESVTIRGLADELLGGQGQSRAVAVLGDLNDEPQAATTQILHGPPGSEIGTRGFDIPDKGDAWRLWSIAPRIPQVERFSRVYRGRGELIDHILLSHALVTKLADARTYKPGSLPSIAEDPTERRGKPASDHSLVAATMG